MEEPVSADGGSSAEDARIAWEPDAETRARARLTRFMAATGAASWDDLHRRSVADVAGFTEAVLRFLDIRFATPYARVMDASRGPAFVAWCVGGRMNITESCLDRHRGTPAWSQPALIWEGEEYRAEEDTSPQGGRAPSGGAREVPIGGAPGYRSLTFAELHEAVERCAAGLRSLGLGKGDAVGLHLPMVPETAVALLALGAAELVSVIVRGSLVQLETPDAMRGRVSAVNSLFVTASNQLGDFRAGLMASWLGTHTAVMVGGVGALIGVLIGRKLFAPLYKVESFETRR